MKLFNKSRFATIIISIGIVISFLVSFSNYIINHKYVIDTSNMLQNEEIENIQKHFEEFVKVNENAIKALVKNKAIIEYIENQNEFNTKILENTFLSFASANSFYDQVRYIDKDGNEVVRINNRDGLEVEKKDKLQNKANRYYFTELKSLHKDDVWFSKIDLNIENNKIEIPIIPTLRVGKAVYKNGLFEGIIILNIKMDTFLNKLRSTKYLYLYIVDKDGNFIIHKNNTLDWSLYLDKKYRLKDEFGLYANEILSSGYKNYDNHLISQKINFDNKDEIRFIYQTNQQYLDKSIEQYQNIFFINLLFIMILSVPLVYVVSMYPNKIFNKLQKLEMAIEQSDNLICITDKHKNIEYVNSAFEKISGYSKNELIGNNVKIVKSKQVSNETYKDMYEHINNGKVWQGEFINRRKNGELYTVKTTISSIKNNQGNIKSYLAVQSDITQDKVLQKELEIKNQILMEQYKFNSLDELLKNIAHHWRQPLNTIALYTSSLDMLNDVDDTKEREEFISNSVSKIEDALSFLSQTIENFKYISREEYKESDFMVSDAIQKSISIIEPTLDNIAVNIKPKISEDFELHTYKDILIDVLLNIYKNAKEAIEIKNECRGMITVEVIDKKIIIKDNGIGIKQELKEKIFEPYFTTKFKSKGVGLSLYIDKIMITNKLNGQIYAIPSDTNGIIVIDFNM